MTTNDHNSGNSFDLEASAFKALGYQFVDLMADVLRTDASEPVLPRVTGDELRKIIDEAVPKNGTPPEKLLDEFREKILPHCRHNGHPRFFGYVCASADPIGMLADGLASALNQNVTAWRSTPAATEIERLVLRWLDEAIGFAGKGHGLLTSGGSSANMTAIAVALDRAAARGLHAARGSNASRGPDAARDRLTVYVSTEGHLSLPKAARILGMGEHSVRHIGVDGDRRMNVAELAQRIDDDLASGLIPACVCASAGTANTGTVDPLSEVAEVCKQRDVWLHIDGAYGAPAAMTDEYQWMKQTFARADSMSLDPHKWLFAPFDVGCVLIRDEQATGRAFTLQTEYTAIIGSGAIERYASFDHGMELSRRFRALKVWMILKARGVDAIAEVIARNIELRKHLDQRIEANPRLERLGSDLSISCFRYRPPGIDDESALKAINEKLLARLVEEGRMFMSPTTLDGRFSLRVCIVNFRTTQSDIDLVVDEVLRVGAEESGGK